MCVCAVSLGKWLQRHLMRRLRLILFRVTTEKKKKKHPLLLKGGKPDTLTEWPFPFNSIIQPDTAFLLASRQWRWVSQQTRQHILAPAVFFVSPHNSVSNMAHFAHIIRCSWGVQCSRRAAIIFKYNTFNYHNCSPNRHIPDTKPWLLLLSVWRFQCVSVSFDAQQMMLTLCDIVLQIKQVYREQRLQILVV